VTLALEQALLAEFTAENRPSRTIVWESQPALVVSPSDRQLPRFENAANGSAIDGWPVSVRSSGGSAVPLGPGVICVSVLTSWHGTPPLLAQGYELVCAPIVAALASIGLAATIGPAPGSFCDGKYNILVDGKKVAGTAQRRTARADGGALLSHAMLIVDADPAALTAVVAKFYDRAGSDKKLDAASVTSLAQLLAPSARKNLRARLTELLRS
jgi:octanoyl-[GcvH]:protein N-octanoyltransferase